eukprot:CAMPEP_0183714096 /NCGR_PEP_ID=MMETSP0737-20130205/8762_1 /TAXON_ID=385413 /ORGANISM="Thalassiosira miniscula, Strain CCMP1093" /LENGTH=403 /DNA_ID=CAMNT_0025943001 /DNA_START=74 /DNA_END=1282 /DNA_ORIENTATION=+
MSQPAIPYSAGAPPMLTPAELQKFEAPLIALANMSGGDLRKLFYAFFSFLHRRTDFYCILPDGAGGGSGSTGGGGRMGFREGQAEQILLASFRQFPLRKVGGPRRPAPAGSASSSSASADGAKSAATTSATTKTATTAPVAKEGSAATPSPKKVEDQSTDASAKGTTPEAVSAASSNDTTTENKNNTTTDDKVATKPPTTTNNKESATPPKKSNNNSSKIRYTEDGKQIPIGNGGSTTRYVWTQTLEEVTVHIPLPDGMRSKDLDVKLNATSISIRSKNNNTAKQPPQQQQEGDTQQSQQEEQFFAPLEGTLFAKIRPSESTWTLESSTHNSTTITTLQLILDKVQKTWWSIPVTTHAPHIDTTLVDSTRHISSYDDETQGEIRRIMHDQRQERLGLPTSSQE